MGVNVLWGSPLPPLRSGVSDYAAELLPELARLAKVRVLAPPESAPWWTPPAGTEIAVVDSATAPAADEHLLLHLGNNPYHRWLFERAVNTDCVLVLHDLVLHHLLVESTLATGDWPRFERMLVDAEGPVAAALVAGRRVGITGHLDPFLFPATKVVLDRARGVVVHSEWARRQIASARPALPVCRVDLSVADPGTPERASLRARLGLAEDAVVLMHLGFLTAEKGGRLIVTALAAACRLGVPAQLVLVGEGSGVGQMLAAAAAAGVGDRVVSTGWVDDRLLLEIPAAADLGLVLRTPSAGETSAAALRFFACGTPVAVNGQHQFLEWPESAAPRICPGPPAAAELTRLIAQIPKQQRAGQWLHRRQAAREVYDNHHRPEQAAAAVVAFLGKLSANS